MERITRGMLERKVQYLKDLGIIVSLDHHQPGGAKYTWAVEDETGSRRLGYSGRMTARECWLYLIGMATGARDCRGQIMTITGTSYFVSLSAACSYYGLQGIKPYEVKDKIKMGDIHIGKPELKPGERLVTVDEGTRYAIEAP